MDSFFFVCQEILQENIMLSARKLKLGSQCIGSQAYLKFHQGLFAEVVLEDSTVAITVT